MEDMNKNLYNGIENNKPMKKAMDIDIPDKDIEEKIFIVLYKLDTPVEDIDSIFSICIGRSECYRDIVNKIRSGYDVDIHRSKITVETKQTETKTGDTKYYLLDIDDCKSIYDFCVKVGDNYPDLEFNIEDYNTYDPEKTNKNILTDKQILTKDQMEYKKMLEESIKRQEFIKTLGDMNTTNI